jgi:hypothetical protein
MIRKFMHKNFDFSIYRCATLFARTTTPILPDQTLKFFLLKFNSKSISTSCHSLVLPNHFLPREP